MGLELTIREIDQTELLVRRALLDTLHPYMSRPIRLSPDSEELADGQD